MKKIILPTLLLCSLTASIAMAADAEKAKRADVYSTILSDAPKEFCGNNVEAKKVPNCKVALRQHLQICIDQYKAKHNVPSLLTAEQAQKIAHDVGDCAGTALHTHK